MDNGKIKTPKVLTTNDIREDARSWTLAGDVGLLAHLEQFSENIITRTQETQNLFTELMDDYEQLYTKVGNITNQFLELQNCQFVENRVYDEETPTEEKVELKVQNEVEQEKLLLMQYKEAVEVGVKLLDSHYEEVELPPNSDSDDDEVSAGNSIIWKPRNPYAGKKFPLLIGSAEWWADDHVGLRADEDILDTEKVISESDSDMESLKSIDKEIKSSSASSVENIKCAPTKPAFFDSSSEDLFGLDKNENPDSVTPEGLLFKGSNAPLEEPETFLPDFHKEPTTHHKKRDDSPSIQPSDPLEEPSEETTTTQPKKVDNAFTRELMAKLSSVSDKKESGAVEDKGENKVAVGGAEVKAEESLFDETDDSNDLFLGSKEKMGDVVVRRKDLFLETENEDDLFKGENDLFSGSSLFSSNGVKKVEVPPVFGNDDDASKSGKPAETGQPRKTLVDELFSDLDDYDTLFTAKSPKAGTVDGSLPSMGTNDSKTAKSVTGSELDWDSGAGLFNSSTAGVDDDFFSSPDLFGINPVVKATEPTRPDESRDKKPGLLSEERPRERQRTAEDVGPFVESGTKKPRGKEVGGEPYEFSPSKGGGGKKLSFLESEDDSEEDLFSKGLREEKKPSVKVVTAFPENDDAALFAEKPKPPDSVSVSSSRSSLFDDVSASKSRLASVFEKDKGSSKAEDDLFSLAEDSLFGGSSKAGKELLSGRPKEKTSLFEDCDDGDDLFGGGEQSLGESVEKCGSVFDEGKREERGAKAVVGEGGEEDLLKPTGTSSKLRETKSDILRQSEQKLFVEDVDDWDLFSSKEETGKPKPPNSLSLKSTGSEAKVKTVGKLNIPDNLKVRLESVAMHMSSGGERHHEEEKKEEEKAKDVLDEPPQSSNLLKCPSKDRVKIPARRRPQSRRARQEAIRNSGVWEHPTSPKDNLHTPIPSKDSLSSPAVSNPLSPSTDEEDFFKVPELDTNFEKEDQSIFKNDFFESSKSSKPDDSLLFDGAPVLSPPSERTTDHPNNSKTTELVPPSASLFGDDDNDDNDDLFKNTKPLGRQALPKSGDKGRKSLFGQDSEEDEEELFGGQSEKRVSGEVGGGRGKGWGGDVGVGEVQRGGSMLGRKEEGGDVVGGSGFVDPLGLITKQ